MMLCAVACLGAATAAAGVIQSSSLMSANLAQYLPSGETTFSVAAMLAALTGNDDNSGDDNGGNHVDGNNDDVFSSSVGPLDFEIRFLACF